MPRRYCRKGSASRQRAKLFIYGSRDAVVPCCFCGRPLSFDEATLEHIRPRSEGGSNKVRNLAISCSSCNEERVVSDFWWFRSWKQNQKRTRTDLSGVSTDATLKADDDTRRDKLSEERCEGRCDTRPRKRQHQGRLQIED